MPRSQSNETLMSSIAQRWNCGRSCGEARASGDDVHRERERELAHELGLAAVDELVDAVVDDRTDGLGLPAFHRLAGERLLDEPAVGVVLGLVHLEDGVAHHRAHDLGVAGRRERLAVAQDRLHGVVAERGEDLWSFQELGLGVRIEQRRFEVLLEHRALGPCHREQRVRVLDHACPDAAVELLERVVGAVDSLGRAHPILTIASAIGARYPLTPWRTASDGCERGELGPARPAGGGGRRHVRPRLEPPRPHARGTGRLQLVRQPRPPPRPGPRLARHRDRAGGGTAARVRPAHAARRRCGHRRRRRRVGHQPPQRRASSCSSDRPKGGST